MTTGMIISGSRPTSLLMGRVWFNCNRVFNGFEFIFSNPIRDRGGFRYCYSRSAQLYFKSNFLLFYFIL